MDLPLALFAYNFSDHTLKILVVCLAYVHYVYLIEINGCFLSMTKNRKQETSLNFEMCERKAGFQKSITYT